MSTKSLTATAAALALSAGLAALAPSAASAQVKLGLLLGYTGPIESLTPHMRDGALAAIDEVNDSGEFFSNERIEGVPADSTCIDSAAAQAAAERLLNSDRVSGIMGADCSGVTRAVLENVAVPNGMVMISPSATSPGLSTVPDNNLFFRTAPSDARQGQVMSEILMEEGIQEVAVTYTNNDYGKGLADSFESAYTGMGGTITINASHEDGKSDYSSEVAALAAAGGDRLVVLGYVDQGGSGIVRAALDSGAFDTFHFADGMIGAALDANFGSEIDGSTGQHPGTDSKGAEKFQAMADGFDGSSPFSPEGYDAAALIMLAMQSAKSTDPNVYKTRVMEVANAPGTKILPGELKKAMRILKLGGDIDYVGASAVELIGPGESAGNYRQIQIRDGKTQTVKYR